MTDPAASSDTWTQANARYEARVGGSRPELSAFQIWLGCFMAINIVVTFTDSLVGTVLWFVSALVGVVVCVRLWRAVRRR